MLAKSIAVLLQNGFQGIHARVMYADNGNVVLLGLFIHTDYHFVGTGVREHNHKVGSADFVREIPRHLCENLCLAVIFFANVFISCSHAVVSANQNNAHSKVKAPFGLLG
jgi:hypothetical protein